MYVIMDKEGNYFEKCVGDENIFTGDKEKAAVYRTEKGAWKDVMFYNMLRAEVVEAVVK